MKSLKNLAEFKRYLADGGRIQLVSSYGHRPMEILRPIRKVEKMQSNSCKFEGGSWLYFPKAHLFEIRHYTDRPQEIVIKEEDREGRLIDALIYHLID
jgi:hypothetical protein